MDKIFITAGELLADSFRLAARVYASGFRPALMAAVWRGGTPVGIAVQEYYAYRGVECGHFPVKTASYAGIDQRSTTLSVSIPDALLERIRPDVPLLLIDDVFDTGISIHGLVTELRSRCGDAFPMDMRIACPWYKPSRNRTDRVPDYYLHETDRWIVFPHELIGLGTDEIRAGKSDLAGMIHELDLD